MSRIIATLALGAAVMVTVLSPKSGAGSLGPRTWHVLAGGSSRDASVMLWGFFPSEFEIGIGDTVLWEIEGPHTITAVGGGQSLPPYLVEERGVFYVHPQALSPYGGRVFDGSRTVSSGLPAGRRATFAVTFTKPGRWTVFCLRHSWSGRGMTGTVVVTDRPRRRPAQVLAQARREQAAAVQKGLQALRGMAPERNGKNVVVPLIGSSEGQYSILSFGQTPLVIRAGTTVTWTVREPFEYHTVTFTSGGQMPPLFIRVPQAAGASRLQINPLVSGAKGQRYTGREYANSGLLAPAWTLLGYGDYRLTFTKPGRYEYVCVVHLQQGMRGVVIVR